MLRDRLQHELEDGCGGVTLNGHETERLPNTLNLRFEGADAEALIAQYAVCRLFISAVRVIRALRRRRTFSSQWVCPTEAASESLRFSLSRHTTREDVDRAVEAIVSLRSSIREALVKVT